MATRVFGDYDHPVVKLLRRFRDDFLEPMPMGPLLIETYYAVGPSLADGVGQTAVVRFFVQQGLLTFASLGWLLAMVGPKGAGIGFGVLLMFVLSLVIPRQRRRP